jgi:polar amino acid transport system permease protein
MAEILPAGERHKLATLKIVRRSRLTQWLPGLIALAVLLGATRSVLMNPNLGWPVIAHYLFSPAIVKGVGVTLVLTGVSMIVGIVLGVALALMNLADNPILNCAARGFVWLFRGVPVLVQLVFWYNLAFLYPTLSLSIPFGRMLWSTDTNSLIGPWQTAILGLGFNAAAYLSEVFRGGIAAVDAGQHDAAVSLGLSRRAIFRFVVWPQAMRLIVPPVTNESITMLKLTALVTTVALPDLFYSAQVIYARTYETIPLLAVVALWYLAITSVMTLLARRIERYYARGFERAQPAARHSRASVASVESHDHA